MWATLIPTQCLKPPCPYYFLGSGAGGSTVLVSTVKFSTNYLVSCLFSKWESNYCLRRAEMMGASCWGHSNERNCVGLLQLLFEGACASWIFVFCVPHSCFALTGWTGNCPQNKNTVSAKNLMYHHCHGSFLKNLEYRHRHGFSVKKNISITIAMDSLSNKSISITIAMGSLSKNLTFSVGACHCTTAWRWPAQIGNRPVILVTLRLLSADRPTCVPQKKWRWHLRQLVSAENGAKEVKPKKIKQLFLTICFGRNWRKK